MTYPPPEPHECTRDELKRAIEFYEKRILECRECQRLHPKDKMGAAQGEMDWIAWQLGYKERLEVLDMQQSEEAA